jgi:hypothetical protein
MQRPGPQDSNTLLLPIESEPLEIEPERQDVKALSIGRPEIRILEAVNRFDQVTAEQLSRYLSYSFRYTQDRCKNLADHSYLQRLTLPKRRPSGGVPYVYTLARRGRQFLYREGTSLTKQRFRPSEQRAALHTLAVNEVLLQVLKLTETDPALSLVEYLAEREFLHDPIKVLLPGEEKEVPVSLIPDLWIHMKQTVGKKAYTYCFCIEVNLTPIEQKRWRRKVSMYLNCQEGYIERLGVNILQVVVLCATPETVLRKGTGKLNETERQERTRAMSVADKTKADYLLWTEKELAQQNKRQEEADLFLFTSAPLDKTSPMELFFSSLFSIPQSKEIVPLIPQEEGYLD